MHKLTITACFLAAASLASCSFFNNSPDAVASVGKYKLYRSQVEAVIPEGTSSSDSANLAMQYINSWAKEILYVKMAESQLTPAELDVSAELEDYRRSLLKFRYEQKYISDRLDTLVTDEQIKRYYETHSSSLQLERPILKVRFVDIMHDSPNYETILAKMSSLKSKDLMEAEELAKASALRYFDNSDNWMDAADLSGQFGVGYSEMLSRLKDNRIVIRQDGRDDVMIAYVVDIKRTGTAPLEFCESEIIDKIISIRKHNLLESLEQDLLKDAMEQNTLQID